MLTRYRHLGDDPMTGVSTSGPAFQAWQRSVNAQQISGDLLSASAVTMPAQVLPDYAGMPAARYSVERYVQLFNAGQIDPNAPQATNAANTFVYVLAPSSVIGAAPHTMTSFERVENAVFTGGDTAAEAIGLPSLAGIESFLKGMGRDILVGVAVTAAVAFVLRRKK